MLAFTCATAAVATSTIKHIELGLDHSHSGASETLAGDPKRSPRENPLIQTKAAYIMVLSSIPVAGDSMKDVIQVAKGFRAP